MIHKCAQDRGFYKVLYKSAVALMCLLKYDHSCCRCPLPEPGPPTPGLPASARSTPPAADSCAAGAFPAAQSQQLLTAQPLPQFQHGMISHLFTHETTLGIKEMTNVCLCDLEKTSLPVLKL